MHGPTKQLARCLAACVPVIGLVMAFGPAAGASAARTAHHHRVTHSAAAIAAAKAELYKMLKSQHGRMEWYGASRPAVRNGSSSPASTTPVTSTNWSGYADTGSNFTHAQSHWVEPTGTCTGTQSLAAFWVGIDGFSSQSVEQDGTLIECNGGSPFYFTWWEMFPTNAIQIVGQTLNPGDAITAQVTRSGTTYTLKLTDTTTPGNSFTRTETCTNCSNNSAEWIAEAPSGSGGVFPLTKFGTWKNSSSKVSTSTKSGVISTFPNDQITMVDGSGLTEAKPSALNSTGNFFQVVWKRMT